jgi:tetratricopeptide (TPR) repeat protein
MKLTFSTSRALLGLCLCLGLAAQQTPDAQFRAAQRMTDQTAKIKELRRIKAEYPNSGLGYSIDYNLLAAVTRNAASFGEMLAAQKEVIEASEVSGRFLLLVNAADMLLNHREASKHPEDVLNTVQSYKTAAMGLLDVPETFAQYKGEMRTNAQNSFKNMFEIPLAKALLMNNKGQEALNVLESAQSPSASYYATLGETYKLLNRDKDALNAYFEATISSPGAATAYSETTKALYAKVYGSSKGFERELDLRKTQRPFQPPPFSPPENWQGKAVLAEVFTGSECSPCVAATFAFDALEKSYPDRYLAVLKYHLPIPKYDPMMNHATKKRQDFYKGMISGTPTAIIDGIASPRVGGDRLATATSFGSAQKEIDAALARAAEIKIGASASLSGDIVTIECEFSREIEGADYNVVLVQTEEDFKGGNGVVRHNMVVRDFKSAAPGSKVTIAFNLVESEKEAKAYITEWGKTYSTRSKEYTAWPATRNKIDRKKLKAVVFVQDKKTKRVYNTFVADVG